MSIPEHSSFQELEVTGDEGLWVQTTSHIVHVDGPRGFETTKLGGTDSAELSIGNIIGVLLFKLAERTFEVLFGTF